MAAQGGKDPREDAVLRGVRLAVHVDRDEAGRRLFHLGKDPLHGSRLAGPRQPPEGDVQRAAAVESGAEGKCDVLHLGFAEMELLGDVVYLEQIPVAEEGLVGIEVFLHRIRSVFGPGAIYPWTAGTESDP